MLSNTSLQNPNFKCTAYKNYWLQVQLCIDIKFVCICMHRLAQVFSHFIWYLYPQFRDKRPQSRARQLILHASCRKDWQGSPSSSSQPAAFLLKEWKLWSRREHYVAAGITQLREMGKGNGFTSMLLCHLPHGWSLELPTDWLDSKGKAKERGEETQWYSEKSQWYSEKSLDSVL